MNSTGISWTRRSYTEKEFRAAWATSKSKSEVLRILGLPVAGGNLNTVTRTAKILELDDSHLDPYWSFRTENPNRIKLNRNTRSLEEILVEGSTYRNTHVLKGRLIAAGIKEAKCENLDCGITAWCGKPAPLALDHINGDRTDNRLENLRILCYNCHGQTATFSGNKLRSKDVEKKIRRRKQAKISRQKALDRRTCGCGNSKSPRAANCRKCDAKIRTKTQRDYPTVEELILGVKEYGYYSYAPMIGLTDNGLRKVLKKLGVNPLPKKLTKKEKSVMLTK